MAHTNRRIVRALLGLALGAQLTACASMNPAQTADDERKARSHYTVALNHLKEGRAGVAIGELQKADALQPNDAWIQLSLSEAYRLKSHNAEAEKYLKRALEIRPDFHAAKLNLSAIYIQVGRYDEAVELSTQLLNALEYHERFWPAILDLAILDEDQGRKLEALEGYEKVLTLKPGPIAEAESHYRMATIYMSLGNRGKAMHHLNVASETRPSGVWGKRSADYLKRLR
jgi:tetratricopeptide (TPR) repeat protein